MRIALAQINPLVGDIQGNAKIILNACNQAYTQGANLLLTPELSLWGYPPRDLLLNTLLLEEQKNVLDDIAQTINTEFKDLGALIGVAEPTEDFRLPKLFNSIAYVDKSGWRIIARKQLLPTHDVFDEKRYFRSAKALEVMTLGMDNTSLRIGVTICEDLWVEEELQGHRVTGPDPIANLKHQKIDLLINLSASPFSHNKAVLRQELASKAARRLSCPVIYLNQIGANDELIFDGSSFVINSKAEILLKLPSCKTALSIWDSITQVQPKLISSSAPQEQLFKALVLGVHDYAQKCGFTSALIGLSGGIDSALVTTIAAAALGGENIRAVLMPSPWSSTGSIKDSLDLAKRLKVSTQTISIETLMKSFDSALTISLGKSVEGIAAENLQSRIRGTLLMALANQQGHLLLSTGNKSELAVGYCTLYGDMNGGLSVIGDLYKSCVFNLCKWIDSSEAYKCRAALGLPSNGKIIGETILQKPPSAELRPGQLDSDSLPDYESLDPILEAFIEKRATQKELINSGHNPDTIREIEVLLKKAEFKRRQAPPLLKVSNQAFGSGWRLPIAAK